MKDEIKNLKLKITDEIKAQRNLRELTQAQMAAKLGVTEKAYRDMEYGNYKIETLFNWLEKIVRL